MPRRRPQPPRITVIALRERIRDAHALNVSAIDDLVSTASGPDARVEILHDLVRGAVEVLTRVEHELSELRSGDIEQLADEVWLGELPNVERALAVANQLLDGPTQAA